MPRDRDIDPNSEQQEPDQAQDVTEDARIAPTDLTEDSERGGHPDRTQVAPSDEPDLVERMKGMVRSGRIDNDAYAGEPDMDDEEGSTGSTEEDA